MLRKHPALLSLPLVVMLAACGGDNNDNNTSGNNHTNGTTGTTGPTETNGTTGTNSGTTETNSGTSDTNNGTTETTNGTGGTNGPDERHGFAIATSSDFASSAFHVVELSEEEGVADEAAFGSGDVVVAANGTYGFALDRTSGAVRVVDDAGQSLGEVAAGEGSNPHSAVEVGGRVVITGYNSAELIVAEEDGGAWTTSNLSLASYDADGNPEAGAMLADGDHVLVVLQRLTGFMGVENSQLLVLDTTDDSFGTPIDLGVKNAQAGLRAFGAGFAVGATGDYGAADGGIVAITRNGAGDYEVGEMIVSEADLGGDLLDFVFVSDTEGLAVISLPDFSSQLWAFDTNGNVEQVDVVSSPGLGGLSVSSDGQFVIVGDRDTVAPGFVVFDRLDTTWQTHYAIPTTLPPSSVAAF